MSEYTLGSVSSGTMRNEDLIPCFADELEACAKRAAPHPGAVDPDALRLVQEARDWAELSDEESESEEAQELGDEIISDLFDALDAYAPPYCYFGAHPGDGADYGYWLSEEWRRQAEEDNVPIVADLGEVPEDYTGEAFQVSDHGNLSLYVRNLPDAPWRELWGIV